MQVKTNLSQPSDQTLRIHANLRVTFCSSATFLSPGCPAILLQRFELLSPPAVLSAAEPQTQSKVS